MIYLSHMTFLNACANMGPVSRPMNEAFRSCLAVSEIYYARIFINLLVVPCIIDVDSVLVSLTVRFLLCRW
jgi:hypothetical protein